jgi:aerobic-type carbon monoxide dehydrogenase small subunit (CoxS/CutS family)
MTTVAMLREMPNPTDQQILAALGGNLCRCCDYTKILKAVRRAAGKPSTSSGRPEVQERAGRRTT